MYRARRHISFASFVWAVVLSFTSLLLPPLGVIDNSVLILIAQVLVLVASCFGLPLPNIIKKNESETDKRNL